MAVFRGIEQTVGVVPGLKNGPKQTKNGQENGWEICPKFAQNLSQNVTVSGFSGTFFGYFRVLFFGILGILVRVVISGIFRVWYPTFTDLWFGRVRVPEPGRNTRDFGYP